MIRGISALFPGTCLAAAAVLLAACGSAEMPPVEVPASRTVRAVLPKDPTSLSLLGKPDYYSEILATQITDSLVQYDENMRLVPRVARSWEVSDDGSTLTFHLRPGVTWHDGRPVTAADIVFSIELARDPLVENRVFGPPLAGLVSVEAPDPATVRARFREGGPDLLEAFRFPLLPSHLAERGAALLTGSFARHPIGCGPFRFVAYRPGEEIVLEANDAYWDGRPRIDGLVFRIYPEQSTGYQALLKGDVHIMNVTPELWQQAVASNDASRFAGFVFYRLSVWQVTWNVDGTNPFFDDANVRRAMLLALDREQFVASMLHGLGRVAATTFPPDLPWTDSSLRPLPHDPDQAGRLLDAAGWIDRDGDGVRERAGVPFRFTLLTHVSSQDLNDQIAVWAQHGWSAIGVRADIEKLDWSTFRDRRQEHRFQAASAGISFTPTPDQYDLYHSSARERGSNWAGLHDAEVDRLVERGRTERDPEERLRVCHALQRKLLDLQPLASLFHLPTPALRDRRLAGVEPTPLDYWRSTRGPRFWHWNSAGEAE